MSNINMKEYLFHAIKPYDLNSNDKIKDETKILINIITSGAIFSRRNLKKILPQDEWNKLCKGHRMNWNKLDWVSIASKKESTIDFIDNYTVDFAMAGMHAFHEHIVKYPSIILNPTLLHDLTIADCWNEEISCQNGEIQVKDKIPYDYFVGIALPDIYNSSEIIEKSNSGYYNTYLYQKLKELDIDDFLNTYYKEVIPFEKALKSINSTLPIYHTETGKPILSCNQELEKLAEVKSMIKKIK